jgi:hypothetical protein
MSPYASPDGAPDALTPVSRRDVRPRSWRERLSGSLSADEAAQAVANLYATTDPAARRPAQMPNQ